MVCTVAKRGRVAERGWRQTNFLQTNFSATLLVGLAVPNGTASHCMEHRRHMCTVCGHTTMSNYFTMSYYK